MSNEKFEVMPQSWYKRRELTDVPQSVTHVEVKEFKKIDNHKCIVAVSFDDVDEVMLTGWVSRSCSYHTDGTVSNERWTVQGINEQGVSVLVKLVE